METMKKIESYTNGLDRVLTILALFLLIVSTVLAITAVILRYVFDTSYQIIEELCRFTIIYGVFLYMGPLVKKDEHIKMNVLQDYMKGKLKIYNNLLISILLLFSFIFFGWASFTWVNGLFEIGVKTLSGSMLIGIPAIAVPLGMVIGIIYAAFQVWLDLHKVRNPEPIN